MKKLFVLLAAFFINANIWAQVTSVLTTPPCNNNGVITTSIVPSSFTAPYTYTYDYMVGFLPDVVHTSSSLNDVLNNYAGGNMFIIVTDANGGTVGYSWMNYQPFQYATSASLIGPCNQQSNVTFTGSSAGPYTATIYSPAWQGTPSVVATGNPVALSNGSYNVLLTDGNGCQLVDDSLSVYNNTASPIQVSLTSTLNGCTSGNVSIASIGGTGVPPYTYLWSNGSTATSINNVPMGTYNVVVTDAQGCTGFAELKLAYATQVNANVINANCINGSITINSVTGGTAPYTYLWNNGSLSNSITGLSQGAYGVTITDAAGCVDSTTFYVYQTQYIYAQSLQTPATCLANDGALTLFGQGGTAPYTYLWSNGTTGNVLSGVPAGMYSCFITDANGCIGNQNGYVSSSSPIYVTNTTSPSACTTPNGSATLNIQGGTPPYTTTWNTFPTAQTGSTASGLNFGLHSFSIQDAVGCISYGSVNVPPISTINFNKIQTNPVCAQANGSIQLNVSGVGPFTYLWNNGATTSSINSIPKGSYSCVVTDANMCTKIIYDYLNASSPIQLGATVTNASCIYTNDGSVQLNIVGATTPYTFLTTLAGSTGPLYNNLGKGGYYFSITDALGCVANVYANVGYNAANNSCYCTASGKVFHDANGNCIQDIGENGLKNIAINCQGFGMTYTDANGNYSFKLPSGTYTLTQIAQSQYPLASCQSNSIVINVTAASNCSIVNNFANDLIPNHDLHVSLWSNVAPPVPGFAYSQVLTVTNNGNVNEPNSLINYKADAVVNTPTMIPGAAWSNIATDLYSTTGNPVNLVTASNVVYQVDYMVPVNTPLGYILNFKDTACHISPITAFLTEGSPWDNVNSYQSIVVGSYDPNFKEVQPAGKGPNGDIALTDSVLEYAVHFQNLGTYKAQNIFVLDTLDADLDWTTLRPQYSSHPSTLSIDKNGVLRYDFKNINLPAKQDNEPASNGMFTYTIKQKKNLAYGTEIKNTAAIYFDFNAPIITNTTLNTLAAPTGIGNAGSNLQSVKVYPNPTSEDLFIEVPMAWYNHEVVVNVSDISGKVVMQKSVVADSKTINLATNTLGTGIYFLQCTANGAVYTQKFVVTK
jgi:uncharacterized repeat protein (TIGR01451 family)